jgi:hypothetical protein
MFKILGKKPGRCPFRPVPWVVFSALALVAVSVSIADAAPRYMRGRWAVGVFAGVNQPLPDFDKILKTGLAVDITGEYYISNVFSLGAYMEAVINNPKPEYTSPDISANARFASLNAVGRFTFQTSKLQPYLLVGGGGYNREIEVYDQRNNHTSTQGGQTTVPGFMGGGGAVYPLSQKVDLLGEVTYHQMFLEEEVDSPETQAYVNVSLGIRVLFGGILD